MNYLRFFAVIFLLASAQGQQHSPDPLKTDYPTMVKALLDTPKVRAAFAYVDDSKDAILKEWIALTEINAPSFHEQERAKAVEALLRKHHLDISYDNARNLIAVRRGAGGGPTVVIDAHLDTVFQPGLKIKAEVKDGRIHAPGVGDNTRNVEALLAIIRALDAAELKTRGDMVFLFTSEEEASMSGAKKYVAENKEKIGHYIALDGGYSGFTYGGIGINHYKFHLLGPGGHTRSKTPPYSATLPAARAIERIYRLKVPNEPPSHINIGMLGAGEVINAKAADAWFTVDLRSTEQAVIDRLEKEIEEIVREEAAREKMAHKMEVISRLAAAQIPRHRDSHLIRFAEALYQATGVKEPPITPTASNNANVAFLAGLSALSTGVGPCDDAHALTENCEIEPIYTGIKRVMALAIGMAGVAE